MHAVDTNVLVRLWVDDDPEQSALARSLVEAKPVWIAKTVLLEAAWVLRSIYGYDEPAICNSLELLFGLENVHIEEKLAVQAALSLCAEGVDFADAFHVMSRPSGSTFVTFDQALLKRAKRAGIADIEHP